MIQSTLSAVFDGLTAVAAFLGVGIAFAGLRAWREQLKGQNEYEVARRLLRIVLEVRDQISFVRNPFIMGGEFAAAYAEAGTEMSKDAEVPDSRGEQLVYDRRWKQLSKALSDLRVELLEAEVLWGPGVHGPGADLRKCVGELSAAIRHRLRSQAQTDAYREDRVSPEVREQHFRVLYEGGADGEDEFALRVRAAVGAFEKFLRPKLHLQEPAAAA